MMQGGKSGDGDQPRIVIHTFPAPSPTDPAVLAVSAHQAALARAHRRGEHPYGSMRRDCPLCNP